MAEYYGKDLQFSFNGPGGSADLTEYQRGASFNPTGQVDVVTTGSAGAETRMVGVKDYTVTYKGLGQTGGTALEVLLQFGALGTVYLAPEGTATGARIYTLPVISQGMQQNYVYNGLTEINVSFVGNGIASYGQN